MWLWVKTEKKQSNMGCDWKMSITLEQDYIFADASVELSGNTR